jgi:hypothetical protein
MGHELEPKLRCDLFIENASSCWIKIGKWNKPIYEASTTTHMNLQMHQLVCWLTLTKKYFLEGQKTMINELYRQLGRIKQIILNS